MNDINIQYKYFAFISYNSKDLKWGKCLQRKLEHYRMPVTLCSERGWKKRNPINPIFFAPTDIQPGGLTEELQDRLRASQNLIVICSPNSAQSEWVGKEIAFFHELGRTKQIHFFIIDGEPHSGNPNTECFNPIVNKLGLPEILGANIHEKIYRSSYLNKERAYVQLISKLLDVEFDTIWQRHKRLLIQKILGWTMMAMLVVASILFVWKSAQPVNVNLTLKESSVLNSNLPEPEYAEVIMCLENENKTAEKHPFNQLLTFENIPSRFVGKNVNVRVSSKDFIVTDTTLLLTKDMTINMYRNPHIYGDVNFWLFNVKTEEGLSNAKVFVDNHETISDEDGNVSVFIPLSEQKTRYRITSTISLLDSIVTMPCSKDFIIKVAD